MTRPIFNNAMALVVAAVERLTPPSGGADLLSVGALRFCEGTTIDAIAVLFEADASVYRGPEEHVPQWQST
jgi:hypothetical protein